MVLYLLLYVGLIYVTHFTQAKQVILQWRHLKFKPITLDHYIGMSSLSTICGV